MMKISQLLSLTVLGLFSVAANAATVWTPTNQDVDYLQFDFLGITTNGGSLAMFDEADFGGTALLIGAAGGEVTFTANGSDWDATFSGGGSITLSGDANFSLGMSWDGGTTWYGDSYFELAGGSPDTYQIDFDGMYNERDIQGTTLAVDLQPVPVPAAVWLFGTGLIGLVGVARRRA
jgi:hypothetical protein